MKRNCWIIMMSLIGVILMSVIVMVFFNKVTAEIPSASMFTTPTKDWTIQFSESMNPDTFTQKTVTVLNANNQPADISFEWNDSRTELTLVAPTDGYMENQKYTLTISDEVKTKKGTNLSQPFIHSFTALSNLPIIENKEQLLTLLKERTKEQNHTFKETAEMEDSSAANEAGFSANSTTASETNVQVSGIDEGDIIKTDGSHIFFVRDSDIIVTSANHQKSDVISTISTENFHPREIYLNNHLLVAIGRSFEPIHESTDSNIPSAKGQDLSIYPTPTDFTTVLIYDVSEVSKPKKVREVAIEGYLSASRMMDGYLYLIANQYPRFRILEETENDTEFRPTFQDTAVSNELNPIPFEDMYFFPDSQETNYLTLASIDLNNLKKKINIDSYLGASNEMYMSKNHIYLAQRVYETTKSGDSAEIMLERWDQANTEIFQFQVDQGHIAFKSSRVVDGTLINQFAMDERNDTFRIATTKGSALQEDEPSINNLYTFDLNLNPLGSVEGLAEGEQIFSVRFMEDIAYIVTFEQVDPLFVIDLKNPKKPQVLGELKIPGFSNYLHPLDDQHILGIGQNTKLIESEHNKEPQVRMDGLKVSLFDVSDPTNPIEKDNEILGRGGSYSEVNHDHNVLYKHPEKNLFGFPAVLFETKMVQQGEATYEEDSFVYEGAFLYSITPEDGIKLTDSLTHQDQDERLEFPEYESQIKRMVSVGDNLYTFSADQFKVYNMKTQKVIHEVNLPEQANLISDE